MAPEGPKILAGGASPRNGILYTRSPGRGERYWIQRLLSPLQGSVLLFVSTPGLRPGLISCAPSGLDLTGKRVSRQSFMILRISQYHEIVTKDLPRLEGEGLVPVALKATFNRSRASLASSAYGAHVCCANISRTCASPEGEGFLPSPRATLTSTTVSQNAEPRMNAGFRRSWEKDQFSPESRIKWAFLDIL